MHFVARSVLVEDRDTAQFGAVEFLNVLVHLGIDRFEERSNEGNLPRWASN